LASEQEFGRLLRSIVEVAGAIFGASVVGIPLRRRDGRARLCRRRRRREQHLVGKGCLLDRIAGWVLSSRTPLVLDERPEDPRFVRDVARAPATCHRE